MTDERYVPHPDGVNAEFHAACLDAGTVCVQRCAACGHYQHPPRRLCASCHSSSYEFEAQPGLATCLSAVVTHRPTSPGWPVPYTTVVAELAVGTRVITSWESVQEPPPIGTQVTVSMRPLEGRFAFLVTSAASALEGVS